jgi:hypothetical protein
MTKLASGEGDKLEPLSRAVHEGSLVVSVRGAMQWLHCAMRVKGFNDAGGVCSPLTLRSCEEQNTQEIMPLI